MPGQQPGQAIYPGQGLPGQAVAPVNPQAGGSPYPPAAGVNGAAAVPNQPGVGGSPQNSQAADMINRILTSPRPGGMPTGAQTGGAGLGNGIAGVASNAEGDSIMVYNDHTKYEEWEFIFDPQKQRQIPNPNATGAGGTPAQQLGNSPGGFPGQPVQPGAAPGAPGTAPAPSPMGGGTFPRVNQ